MLQKLLDCRERGHFFCIQLVLLCHFQIMFVKPYLKFNIINIIQSLQLEYGLYAVDKTKNEATCKSIV